MIGGAIFLVALLVASVVVALLDREASLPQGTPEAAVQLYLGAVKDERYESTYGFLSKELQKECSLEQFAGGNDPGRHLLKDQRVTLERTATVRDTVFVTVRITELQSGGPFGSGEWSHDQRFALRQEEGQWRFSEYPWPFFRCGPFEPERPKLAPTPTPAPPTPTPSPLTKNQG